VHGDLSPKNVQVRSEGADSTLLPFDWENAGWGVPAADMAQLLIPPRDHLSLRPDLEAYWVVAKEAWPQLTTAEVRQVGALGTLFRLIALMSWASSGLSEKRPQKTVRTLRFYEPAFATALDEALA
jgi:Ser/Thr protein kinase RdoA (MazF antagonist)